MKFEELLSMLSSSDWDDVMMAVGLFNIHIDEYSEKEIEYMAYLVPSRFFTLLNKRCMKAYSEARIGSFGEYESSLPRNTYELRTKIIDNINLRRFDDVSKRYISI